MGIINFAMGQLITFLVLGLVVAGVMKVFQVASELSQIKDILGEIKRSLSDGKDLGPASLTSPEHLVRAVNAEGQAPLPLYDEELLKKLRE
jgi:hypothetical protein